MEDEGEAAAGAVLHVVTGKGGAGKSTVAAALALGLAAGGRRVLLVDVEARHSAAAPLGLARLPESPARIARAAGGGEVHGCATPAEAALADYLAVNAPRAAAAAARRLGVAEFAASIAPGLADVLLSGMLVEHARGGGYHAVVADAPPTGRVARFLDVTATLSRIAAAGPVHRQAAGTAGYLRSPATRVHLVALAEPLPVAESLEALAELRAAGLTPGMVALNRMLPPGLVAAAAAADAGGPDLLAAAAGALGAPAAAALAGELADVAARAAVQRAGRAELAAGFAGEIVELPALAGGVRVAGLYELAGPLAEAAR